MFGPDLEQAIQTIEAFTLDEFKQYSRLVRDTPNDDPDCEFHRRALFIATARINERERVRGVATRGGQLPPGAAEFFSVPVDRYTS